MNLLFFISLVALKGWMQKIANDFNSSSLNSYNLFYVFKGLLNISPIYCKLQKLLLHTAVSLFSYRTNEVNPIKLALYWCLVLKQKRKQKTPKKCFVLQIGQPCAGFAKLLKKGMNETLVKAYFEYLVDIAVLYGADRSQAVKDMKQYLEFRIEQAKVKYFN